MSRECGAGRCGESGGEAVPSDARLDCSEWLELCEPLRIVDTGRKYLHESGSSGAPMSAVGFLKRCALCKTSAVQIHKLFKRRESSSVS